MRKKSLIALCVAGVIAAAVVGIVANEHVISAGNRHMETPRTLSVHETAIVLGAGMAAPGVPGPVLVDRLQLALDLYRDGRVRHVLVSGDNDGDGIDEVNPMRSWLVARGVPSADIYMDHAGFRTHDTMRRAAQVFEVRDAIICTQGFHLARSVYLARASGIEAVGVAAPSRAWRTTSFAQMREAMARVKAVGDVMLDREPRYLGATIPIGRAPASATHDSDS